MSSWVRSSQWGAWRINKTRGNRDVPRKKKKKKNVVFLCCSVCSTSVPFLLDVVSLSVPQFSHLENGNINPCFPEEPGANSFSVAAFTCFMSWPQGTQQGILQDKNNMPCTSLCHRWPAPTQTSVIEAGAPGLIVCGWHEGSSSVVAISFYTSYLMSEKPDTCRTAGRWNCTWTKQSGGCCQVRQMFRAHPQQLLASLNAEGWEDSAGRMEINRL